MALVDLKLTNGGDVELNTLSQPTYLYKKSAIQQIVRAAFSLWRGNWFRDPLRGVQWLRILKAQYTTAETIDVLSVAIRRVSYITDVIDITLDVDKQTRVGKIIYTVEANGVTVSGEV
jgi:hypothetical protein